MDYILNTNFVSMKEVNFLIVGGGIAGCLMAFELMERGQSVAMIDDANRPGSSMIAARVY